MAGSSIDNPTKSALQDALTKCKSSLYTVAAFSFFINLLSFAVPLYLLQIYDRVIPSRSEQTLIVLTVIALTAIFAYAGLEALRGFMLAKVGNWVDRRVGADVFRATVVRAKKRSQSPSQRGIRYLHAVRDFVGGPNIVPLFDIPWTPLFIIALWIMHPLLGGLAIFGAVLLLAIGAVNEWATHGVVNESQDASSRSADLTAASARNADVIEAMGMRETIAKRWSKEFGTAADAENAVARRAILMSAITQFTRMTLQIVMLGLAASLILMNQLSAGAIIASMLLFRRATSPMERGISSWKAVVNAREGKQKLEDYLSRIPDVPKTPPIFDARKGLKLRGVTYFIPGRDKGLLRGLNLDVHPGDAVGIMGPTAAGKSTLARIIIGNLAPSSGKVTFAGVDVAHPDRTLLGPHIGYLPQSVELFDGTIRENIARMTKGDLDSVIEAARLVGIHSMISEMPNRYDTEIGDGGSILSGGQRQRVGLARAVYETPKLVVLDEPDASLDVDGRKAIQRTIRKLKEKGSMVVLISHDPSTIESVDRLYELRNGRLDLVKPEVKDEPVSEVANDSKLRVVEGKSNG